MLRRPVVFVFNLVKGIVRPSKERPRAGVDSTQTVLDHAGAQLLDLRWRRGPSGDYLVHSQDALERTLGQIA
jgi:hypothetical protein